MDDGENKQGLNIMPIVFLLAGLIILVVLIFLIRGCTKSNKDNNQSSMPSCKIDYSRSADKGNVYTANISSLYRASSYQKKTVQCMRFISKAGGFF